MRVLLVEDDAMIAEAVSANLKDGGYAVDWVKNGAQVAAAAAAQPYDLMLLDLGLPGRDGLDVLSEIRAAGCTVPVLIVTARDDLYSRLNGLDGGSVKWCVIPQSCNVSGRNYCREAAGGIEQQGVCSIAGFVGEAGCHSVAFGFGR